MKVEYTRASLCFSPLYLPLHLKANKYLLTDAMKKIAPFSPLVHAGRRSGEGYAHSNAPQRKRSPKTSARHRAEMASPCRPGAWDVWHCGDFQYSTPPPTPAHSKRMGLESDLWFQQHRHRKPRTSPIPSLGNVQTWKDEATRLGLRPGKWETSDSAGSDPLCLPESAQHGRRKGSQKSSISSLRGYDFLVFWSRKTLLTQDSSDFTLSKWPQKWCRGNKPQAITIPTVPDTEITRGRMGPTWPLTSGVYRIWWKPPFHKHQ